VFVCLFVCLILHCFQHGLGYILEVSPLTSVPGFTSTSQPLYSTISNRLLPHMWRMWYWSKSNLYNSLKPFLMRQMKHFDMPNQKPLLTDKQSLNNYCDAAQNVQTVHLTILKLLSDNDVTSQHPIISQSQF